MKYNFNNTLYKESELQIHPQFSKAKSPVIAYGSGISKKDIAYVFTAENEFIKWSEKHNLGMEIATMYKDIAKARKEKVNNKNYIKTRQIEKEHRVAKDMKALARITGLKYNSKELFLRATRDSLKTEGPVFDPASLYTGTGFSGSVLYAAVPLPNLNWWPGFNNNISSVRILGICVLYSGSSFSGISRVLVGVPFMEIPNLGSIGFNNITSSAYVYLY